jgi:CelD/BcsL family acetyltransferase involved in cellulose biosynthesis
LNIQVKLITTQEEFRALEGEWNPLLQDSKANNIFLTWEWIFTWWEVFGDGYQLWVLQAFDTASNLILGLAPLYLHSATLRAKLPRHTELSFIGTNKVSPDHLDFIMRNSYEEQIASAFMAYINSHINWDILRLDGLNSNSPIIPYLASRVKVKHSHKEESVILLLPESYEELRAQLNKKLRKNVERYTRNLEMDQAGKIQRRRVIEEHELVPALNTVIQLSGQVKESQEKTYALKKTDILEFHKRIVLKFHQNKWVRLYQIKVGDEPIAASYCFTYNGTVSYYQSGYSLNWKQYGPGQQIRFYSIAESIRDGMKVFDFLRGEHSYKKEWSSKSKTDLYFKIGFNLKGKILVTLDALARTLRDTPKSQD